MNMWADVLRQGGDDPSTTPDEGSWVNNQDPDSGEIIRVWEPNTETQDDPDTPEIEGLETFRCVARGIVDGGIRVAGTTERFSEIYDADDYVRIQFGTNITIGRRDRITNIRNSDGIILWREEDAPNSPPTVFGVVGVTPIVDPFGRHTENMALLERVETQ